MSLTRLRVRRRLGFGVSATVQPGMDFAREPDPEWQTMLDRLDPPQDGLGRLVPWWDAGDRWQPIHRWIVLQVQPWHVVRPEIQRALEGPHPRAAAFGRYKARVQSASFRGVDRLCYEAYHELKRRGIRGWPRRFWVVQGPNGGHPFRLSRSEEARWEAEGRPHLAPAERDARGDLVPGAEYAPFDARVIRAITEYDLWQYSRGFGDSKTAHVTAILRRQQANERTTRQLAWQMQHELIGQYAPELRHAMRKDGVHYHRFRPVGEKPHALDYDRAKEVALNTLNTEIPA